MTIEGNEALTRAAEAIFNSRHGEHSIIGFGARDGAGRREDPTQPQLDLYFDFREIGPWLRGVLGELMADTLIRARVECDAVVGFPNMGAKLGEVVARRLGKSFFSLEKASANEVPRFTFRGPMPDAGMCLVLADDVLSAATSMRHGLDAVYTIPRVRVAHAVVVVNRQQGGDARLRERYGVWAHEVFTGRALLEFGYKRGHLADDLYQRGLADLARILVTTVG
jgi:orotate phosphoribosyltransferase